MQNLFKYLLLTIILLTSNVFAKNSNCVENIRHMNTFYWAALEEFGSVKFLDKSKHYLDLAKKSCKSSDQMAKLETFEEELANQFDMSSDTMEGLWPVSQFMTRELLTEHPNLKNYVVYDPDVNIAALMGALEYVVAAFNKYGKSNNINVIVRSSSFRGGDFRGRDSAIESEVIYSLNKEGNFFLTTPDVLKERLSTKNFEAFYNGEVSDDLLEEIQDIVKSPNVLIVDANELDEVDRTFMFEVKATIYDLEEKSIVKDFIAYGFSHDQNVLLERMWFIGFALFMIAFLFSFSDFFNVTTKLINHSHIQQFIMTIVFFALGFVIPNDLIMPMVATVAPDPDEILRISWWWPMLAFVLCVAMTPAIVRAISSSLLAGAKKLSFKLYDDKNYVVLGLGNAFSFITIYLNHDVDAAHLDIFLIGVNLLFVYAIMGRYMQSTSKSQVTMLVWYFPSIVFAGVGYLSADVSYMIPSVIFSIIAFAVVFFSEKKTAKSSHTCDLTGEAEFEALFKALDIVEGAGKDFERKEFFLQGSDPQDGPVFEVKEALHDEKVRWINVVGKSGSGKSMIIHEAVNEYVNEYKDKHKEIPHTINAHSVENDEDGILGAFRRAIKQLPDDIYNTAGQEEKNTWIQKLMGVVIGDLLDMADDSVEDDFEGRSNEIINALIIAASKDSVVMIIEDCDNMSDEDKKILPILADMFIHNKEEKYQKIMQNITFVFGARSKESLLTYSSSVNIEAELPNQHEVEFFLKNTFKFSEKASKDFSNMLNGVFNWKNVVRKLETLAYTGSLESVNGSIELTGNWSDYFESEE
jgi:hypothetical protein